MLYQRQVPARSTLTITVKIIVLGWVWFTLSSKAFGEDLAVAVASNFLNPFRSIANEFKKTAPHTVRIISGSTGSLFAQISNGAPYHVFLAADSWRPKILEEKGIAVQGSRYVYARGRLTLWSADPDRIGKNGIDALRRNNFRHLAIANPKTAPYGQASIKILEKLDLLEALSPLIVRGGNIGQTFQFVFTGNAELGFVSLSQVLDPKLKNKGSRWDIPEEYHDPLEQSVVLLKKGQNNKAAKALMRFLKGAKAKALIQQYGYELE